SRLLAARHGCRVYHADRTEREHLARADPERFPLLHAARDLCLDERRLRRSPRQMADDSRAFHRERFLLIVADLVALPAGEPVVVEGFGVLPELVVPLLPCRSRAAWLISTPAFRRRAIEQRGTLWSMPRQTSDPERALANRLARDQLLAEAVEAAARALGLAVFPVDGRCELEEIAAAVETLCTERR